MPTTRLQHDRRPGSVSEARTIVAYNERILLTSQSPQRRDRAERMLINMRPELARLERAEADRLARLMPRSIAAPAPDDDFEVVFSGKDSLSKFRKE